VKGVEQQVRRGILNFVIELPSIKHPDAWIVLNPFTQYAKEIVALKSSSDSV